MVREIVTLFLRVIYSGFGFLKLEFFSLQEGANQTVPEALMDMAMKVRTS